MRTTTPQKKLAFCWGRQWHEEKEEKKIEGKKNQ
jgi:hypothetical protein